MATSYTSLLGLALPVTGELAGTWGDTVNNSITSLLDTAVAGTTTLSTDADVTLTTTTGASNQARQAILLCSGARTALRNITAPAQSKIYVVINNTTGGFGVVIRGVGPTTGVTVANGKTAVVVWNGSDFVEVAPAAATTATNLAGGLAGSLPYQTAAGTTTMLAIGTANYVLTSTGTAPTWTINTGTGSVVRATSPTIATPTVTTSATVPLLIGGTGTTSTLALRSTSGVGAAGADIIFQTGNNGATEAMRILNSGNVGIGTASPGARLDITSTAAFMARFSGPANSYVDVTDGTGTFRAQLLSNTPFLTSIGAYGLIFGTNNTERMRIDSSGNVGIGTNSPTATLDVRGTAYVIGAGGTRVTDTSAGNGFEVVPSTTTNVLSYNRTTLAYLPIRWRAGVQSWEVDNVERMRIDSSGNVGIGTTSPQAKLHVAGSGAQARFEVTTAADARHEYYRNSVREAYLSWDANILSLAATQASGVMTFVTGGTTERMRIDSSGNLGLGTTTPNTRLTVAASGSTPTEILRTTSTASAATYVALQAYNASSAAVTYASCGSIIEANTAGSHSGAFVINTVSAAAAVERLRIDSSGNVGIGTTSPQGNLQVSGTGGIRVTGGVGQNSYVFVGGVNASDQRLVITDVNNTESRLWGRNNVPMTFYTNDLERLRIDSSGNVGIGTNAPGTKLEVAGASKANYSIASGPLSAYASSTGGLYSFFASSAGTLNAVTDNSGTAGTLILATGAERMRIDSSGRVLIGQTASRGTVSAKLQVDDSRISITAGGASGIIGGIAPASSVSNSITIEADPDNVAASSFVSFNVDATERMRIDSSGRLLVASTTASGSQMDIVDATGQNNRALTISRSATDAAAKSSAISNRHWLNAEEPVILVGAGIDDNTNNFVRMGGGFSNLNSATILQFYTASNNATLIGTERMRIDASGNVGIGTIAPVNKLQVNGSFGRNAPVTKTGSFTLADTENWIICNGTGTITVTLPAASSWTGREVMIKTIAAFTVVSVASDVVPLAGGAAGTAILAATAGKFATLVSDGTNWIIMQAN